MPRPARRSALLVAALAGTLVVSPLGWGPPAGAEPGGGPEPAEPSAVGLSAGDAGTVLVDARDRRGLAAVRAQDAEKLADYGTTSLWRATDGATTLNDVRSVVPTDDLTTIGLRDGELDTSADVPAPSYLAAEPTDDTQLRLVQFAGPVQQAWLDTITATGAELVAYQPSNAYVVRASAAAAAALDALVGTDPVVQYSGPFDPAYRLAPELLDAARDGGGTTREVTVQVVDGDTASFDEVVDGRRVVRPATTADGLRTVTVRAAQADLDALAALPGVYNVEPYATPELLDERQGQLLAGNLTTTNGKTVPTGPGYLAWLASRGFPDDPSAYPVVTVVDDGLDTGGATPTHSDFFRGGDTAQADRVVAAGNCTTDAAPDDEGGHGTLNAGIVGGYNSGTGAAHEDADGYQYGLGVSPYGRVSGLKIFTNAGAYNVTTCGNTDAGVVERAYAEGAQITSNSWGSNVNGRYDASSQAYDRLTRDASSSTAGSQEMLHVFSAGNAGSGARTIGSPGTAKNVLTIGATENVRDQGVLDGCNVGDGDSDSDIATFSSRGPTTDGRAKPDMVAAGTHVQGPASQDPGFTASSVCGPSTSTRYYPAGQTRYTWSSGTSHSTPAISGAASLTQEYYGRRLAPGATASPAMLRALLGNVPRALSGVGAGGTLPGAGQGWGVPDLDRLFDPGLTRSVTDQSPDRTFTAAGQDVAVTDEVADPDEPVRVTLAWTDAPGATTGNSWVNDLDLEVTAEGVTYRGNVFSGSSSVAGGVADTRNNLENVFLPAGTTGPVTVRVVARGINGDGVPGNATSLDQDYALVTSNVGGELSPDPVARPAGITVTDSDDADEERSPGEQLSVSASVRNAGRSGLPAGSGTLTVVEGPATVLQGATTYDAIDAGERSAGATPYRVRVAPYAACEATVRLRHTYEAGGQTATEDSSFVVGPAGQLTPPTSHVAQGLPLQIKNPALTTSPLTVPDVGPGGVGRVRVHLDAAHPYVGDLTVTLVSPAGTRTTLVARRGGVGDNFTGTVFDDTATRSIVAGTAPFTGSFRPEQALSALRGEPASGTWRLEIADADVRDDGQLLGWSLDLERLDTSGCVVVGERASIATTGSGTEGAGSVELPVTLVDRSTGDAPVSATFTPRAGTATAGADFDATPVTVTWQPGDAAEKTVVVPITDDRLREPSETFALVATGGVATGRAVVTITDDDLPPATPEAPAVTRGDRSVGVSWSPVDGRGDEVTGYAVTASPGGRTATVAGDATSATIDGLDNGTPYTVTLTATNAVGTSEPSPASASVTPAAVPDQAAAPQVERGDGEVVVRWQEVSGNGNPVTGYTVTTSPGGAEVEVGPDARSATVDGLDNGTAYTATVTATNQVGDGPASEPSAAVTPAGVPLWSATPKATREDGAARVTWVAPSANGAPVTGYTVTASPGGASVRVGPDATRATVDGLENGTGYTFVVAATNDVGDGTSAPTASTTPAAVPARVAAPTAQRGDGAATVSWSAPAGNGADVVGYLVTASPGGMSARVDGDATTATVQGLVNGAAYTFTVQARNDVGYSEPSDPSPSVMPAGAPGAPRQVTATRGDSALGVTWLAASANGAPVSGYVVTASPGGARAEVDGSATSARLTGLDNGTAYTVTVTAANDAGTTESETSDAVTPAAAPARMAAPTVERGDGSATVSWTPPAANGAEIEGYLVTVSPGGISYAVEIYETSAVVRGLSNGATYTFRVKARNAVGSSVASEPSAPVTPARAPDAPRQVTATRGDRSATVTWQAAAPQGTPVTGYVVSASPGSAEVQVEAGERTARLTGLSNGVSYTFTVRATSDAGDSTSEPSDPVVAAGAPSRVAAPTVTLSGRAATVRWTAPADNGAAVRWYRIESDRGRVRTVAGDRRTAVMSRLGAGRHTFRVTAMNDVGASPAGRPTSVTVRRR